MRSSHCADRRHRAVTARIGPLLVAVWVLCLAGCGDASSPRAADAKPEAAVGPVRVELEPVDGSGTSGSVAIAPAGGGAEIRLSLEGLPAPGSVYVGAIYGGTCADEIGAPGGPPAGPARREGAVYRFVHGGEDEPADDEDLVQTLTSVEPGPDGSGSSVTPLPATVGELLAGGPKYVDVHGEDDSALACADLAPASSSNA